ncbi:MAG TPA: hypothetical protein VGE07_29975 [Herpetosiphonaceae bacterium]
MTATTFILSALSPLLVALLRRCRWPETVIVLLSLLIVAALYVLGQWLDGALAWPLSAPFWTGLAAAWGVQQAAYKFLLRGSTPIAELERFADGSGQ